ncbi:apolipoprotein N-acyltransferase [Clostridium disporicum]|jgi:apolipoprotein N-acyltransferase|uniref:Apolipoprotein N-acyltransferase n=1 Tax=Clostridium disporicum TaxID=84024 RepID=A0A174HRD2_9CLOT|nr:apolipoprotein N-acyltransferase [Clostridium disporicum]
MKTDLYKGKILIIILSAIISGISFTVDNLGILMWISFIPLINILIRQENTFIKIFKIGTIFGTTYYLVLLHWIFNLYPFEWLDLGKTKSIIILFCGWILISLLEGLVIGIVLGIFKYLKVKNNLLNIFTIASLWVVIEYIQEQGLLGFPWGKLAISQVDYLPIIQSISLFGSSFISFIIIVFNGMILEGLVNYKKNKAVAMKLVFIAILIFIVNIAYGYAKLNERVDSKEVNVTVVQGNINTTEKWQKGDIFKSFNIYKELTVEAVENSSTYGDKTEVVLWPETAIPIDISKNSWILQEYKALAKSLNVTFMTGTFYTDYKNDCYKYNSIVAINSDGDIEDIYFKRHLVPFGEVLPF